MKGIAWCKGQDEALAAGWNNPCVTPLDVAIVLMAPLDAVYCRAKKLGLPRKNTSIPPRLLIKEDGASCFLLPGCGGMTTWIDEIDIDLFLGYPRGWIAHKEPSNCYVYSREAPLKKLHRVLLEAPDGIEVDHINGDGMDNRRANLRLASRAQNTRNSRPVADARSELKGVWPHANGSYRGFITKGATRLSLGYYKSEQTAGRAYDVMARLLFGEFAYLNFPDVAMTTQEISSYPTLARAFERMAE